MELRKNRIKHKLSDGQVATVVSGITHPNDIDSFGAIAEATGIDGIWLEGEHGPVDAAELGNLTRACDIWDLTSVVRINDNHQGLLYRTLDGGAQSIVVPHVNTRAEAENVVQGGKFAPVGARGLYGSRQYHGVADFTEAGNDETCLIVLIEDILAHSNLDEILEVDHIDVFFVAPSDFASSMGYIGKHEHPEVQAKIDDSIRRIVAAGRTAGTLTSAENVATYVDKGVRFALTSVGAWLQTGAAEYMSHVRV
jgi:4-hydroxy-2-oxoheptanedioate aldolase